MHGTRTRPRRSWTGAGQRTGTREPRSVHARTADARPPRTRNSSVLRRARGRRPSHSPTPAHIAPRFPERSDQDSTVFLVNAPTYGRAALEPRREDRGGGQGGGRAAG